VVLAAAAVALAVYLDLAQPIAGSLIPTEPLPIELLPTEPLPTGPSHINDAIPSDQ